MAHQVLGERRGEDDAGGGCDMRAADPPAACI